MTLRPAAADTHAADLYDPPAKTTTTPNHGTPKYNGSRALPFRQLNMYDTSRTQNTSYSQNHLPTNQDVYYDAPSYNQAAYHSSNDGPPSLPLPPISPRWDSLSPPNTLLSTKNKGSTSSPSSSDHIYLTQDVYRRPSVVAETSHNMSFSGAPPQTITPPGSESEPRASLDSMRSQNFSRPRKLSLKQPASESPQTRQTLFPSPFSPPPDAALADLAPPTYSRPRGQSSAASSIKSTSTYATAPLVPSGDPHGFRLRQATTAPVSRLPPLLPYSAGRVDSTGSAYTRDMAPWISADESRSSYRSQWSSAQGTWTTERSSIVTRESSVPSFYGGPDEVSLDDVMGMYEKGFHDSSPEDFDEPEQSQEKKEAIMNRRNTRILEALEKPLPAPVSTPASSLTVPNMGPVVRESLDIFRADHNSSPLSKSTTLRDEKDNEDEANKRDSAKSMHESLGPHSRQPSTLTTSSAPSVNVEPEDPESRDRYGFKKQNQYISREQYDTWNAKYSEYLARRRKKWMAYQKENELMTDRPNRFPPICPKTKRFVRKGIPPEWRGAAWFYYAGGPAILAKHSGLYADLLKQEARSVDVEAIERDLHRTFPDNIRFKPANVAGMPNTEPAYQGGSSSGHSDDESTATEPRMISSLRRVLTAFAIFNPRIGYCQSLNFLAGLLLLFLETEEQSFWLLNVIARVYLPGTHEMSLEGSKVDLGVLMASIRESMPAVWAKIGDEMEGDPNARPTTAGSTFKKSRTRRFRHVANKSTDRLPPVTLCMQSWFMSCFIGTLPIESTLRVWDIFFYEGSKTLFRIALTIFKVGEAEIKAIVDPMEMFSVVQAMPRRLLDVNSFLDACYKRRNGFGHVSQDTIDSQRQERRLKVQTQDAAAAGRTATGNASEPENKPRRKGTLFGRRTKKPA